MKADFNVTGENTDAAWEIIHNVGTRFGQTAPYCRWNELKEMYKSGEINLCSHTYALHKYNRQKRVGMMVNDGESIESYTEVIKEDYSNGINKAENTKSLTEIKCNHLASAYSTFIDVNETDWFIGSVYHVYVNSLMLGTSNTCL